MFLEISQNSQENTCARVSFLNVAGGACSFIKKETLAFLLSLLLYYYYYIIIIIIIITIIIIIIIIISLFGFG